MDAALREALEQKIERTVTQLFQRFTTPKLVYHNLAHTQTVVQRAGEIAAHYSLGDADRFILLAAAWWHDTGQLFSEPVGHEEESARLADAFFSLNQGVAQQIVVAIERAILATKMPQAPHSLVEEILCDADTYHLGTDDFLRTNELVRQEVGLRGGSGDDNWDEATAKMMRMHRFHTSYCQQKLAAGKAKNIERLLA